MKKIYNFVTKNQILKKALHNELELIYSTEYSFNGTKFLIERYFCKKNCQYYSIFFLVLSKGDTKFYCAYQHDTNGNMLFIDDIVFACRAHHDSVSKIFRVVQDGHNSFRFYYYD